MNKYCFVPIVASLILAGCGKLDEWDDEYICTGQEQSETKIEKSSYTLPAKKYKNEVDFHFRSQQVMFKSVVNPISSRANDEVKFGYHSVALWSSGVFNTRTGELLTIESRSLDVAGSTQNIKLTGQYICSPRKARGVV